MPDMIQMPGKKSGKLDVICLGRANMDLYALEHGKSLLDTTGFKKSVGGSPANIAVGLSQLGSKAGFISKVADDQVGRYVTRFMSAKGVDVSQVHYDTTGRKTSLALVEVCQDKSDVVFYRKHATDLGLTPEDIDESYIAQSRMLLLTGNGFASSPSREACFRALELALKNDCLVVFDMDYRPSEWENPEETQRYFRQVAEQSHVVVGNDEEFSVMMGAPMDPSLEQAIKDQLFQANVDMLVVKYGKKGSNTYFKTGHSFEGAVYEVEALKPYGAGDAFLAGVCHGMLQEMSPEKANQLGAASAALVVSREGCAEAMPTLEEVNEFLKTR